MKRVKDNKRVYRDSEKKEKPSILGEILGFVKTFVVTAIVFFLFVNFIAHPVNIVGRSMHPNLQDGEFGFTSKISLFIGEVKRGDVVVVTMEEKGKETHWVKRIVGMPGETVSCKDDVIYINGEALDESAYIDEAYKKKMVEQYGYFNKMPKNYYDEEREITVAVAEDFEEVTLGKDEYFVMGDNRIVSKDSRDPSVGPVKKDQLFGKQILVFYPFSHIGIH
ncbi:MAG: signal peptidase I [Holdemanella sp.]|nr:signal peptidase I [Holdemanella sp.]